MNEYDKYPLHKAAFFNDTQSLLYHIKAGRNLYEQDHHGNTALHISTMLGHREATALLLSHNAPVKIKNCNGWNCLSEAVSYGDRQIITEMLRKLKSQARANLAAKRPGLIKMLNQIGDFYLEFKWDFQSWIPLLSRMLPSDICQIYKKGTKIRMDTSIATINELSMKRGDISFLFDALAKEENRLYVLDNKMKVYQRARNEESVAELDEEVDVLMSSDNVSASMSTKPITFEQAYAGWLFKHVKEEQIGDYAVNFYVVDGLKLVTRKRREHLSPEDVHKNKTLIKSLTTGSAVSDEEYKGLQHRKSLNPPGRMPTTWEEYRDSPPSLPPPLGRPQVIKTNEKMFKAVVGMSEDFPLSVEVLLDILEIVAPFKHIQKMRRFCESRLPPGFPVRLALALTACRPKAFSGHRKRAQEIDTNDVDEEYEETVTRHRIQTVYFWPNLTDEEKTIPYKKWYDGERWNSDQPYVLIRKSRNYAAYSDAKVESIVQRTVLYISQDAFEKGTYNHSRGEVMDQLVRYMGIKRELARPDAPSYIQPLGAVPLVAEQWISPEQLQWPFDPESITVPLWARDKYSLTQYCPARSDADIGAGRRVGLLTKWDVVKLNSLYCSERVVSADPHR
ncbi:hypothetical protein WR25_18784 [Diploscapter pachys]|uniref:Ankyrin repeat domain-containing protein n=1 Tax=Diploscapter pachys TaxID=2018661 RepID=A0A2A2JQX7_9BILA|nr:hypothetical protein WR25_18784 [Diploscapter pachys]